MSRVAELVVRSLSYQEAEIAKQVGSLRLIGERIAMNSIYEKFTKAQLIVKLHEEQNKNERLIGRVMDVDDRADKAEKDRQESHQKIAECLSAVEAYLALHKASDEGSYNPNTGIFEQRTIEESDTEKMLQHLRITLAPERRPF